jgi:hypothetical protein
MEKRTAPGSTGDGQVKRVVHVDARQLLPSAENDQLYRERTVNDADYRRLVESVRKDGVQAPLLLSSERYIISGHQRRRAAIETGRFMVPVIVLNIRRADCTSDEWLALLREHNTGREKTWDELVREKLVDIDPDEAVAQIENDRIERSRARVPTIVLSNREMKRASISPAKRRMADAIQEVLADLEEYLPVSLRAIHYRLLVKSFFRHAKRKLPYENNPQSYKDLSDLATRMRLAGEIPWASISDETRPVTTLSCWRSAADFIGEKSERFLRGYARDLLQSQCLHFEIVVEKLTVKNFVEPIAGRYLMPVVVLRGNSGIDARYQLVERFEESSKDNLFLLCLGDCDPDGDSIVDSTLRSLRDDFNLTGVKGVRVAMTHAQADELHLPRKLDAKETSPNYRSFVDLHGRTDCYELEAVEPEVLQEWLETAIRGVIDIEAYNHECDEQKAEAATIQAKRRAVLDIMRGDNPD